MDININASNSVRPSGPKPRECGCKGIRTCRLCETPSRGESKIMHLNPQITSYYYCVRCGKAWKNMDTQQHVSTGQDCHGAQNHKEESDASSQVTQTGQFGINGLNTDNTGPKVLSPTECNHEGLECRDDFEGILMLENFVTEEEEAMLDKAVSETIFVNSQSGRRKQDYGPKVNFKKQKIRTANFNGLPSYSQFLYERIKTHQGLNDFEPVELCNLEYTQARGAHIDPHFDDIWLWGERLVTLNLLSDSVLTFTLDSDPNIEIKVPLFQRSLISVSSSARYKWKHSISPDNIKERRIAMTFRELSKEFSSGGEREKEGSELLKLALTFHGCAVGS